MAAMGHKHRMIYVPPAADLLRIQHFSIMCSYPSLLVGYDNPLKHKIPSSLIMELTMAILLRHIGTMGSTSCGVPAPRFSSSPKPSWLRCCDLVQWPPPRPHQASSFHWLWLCHQGGVKGAAHTHQFWSGNQRVQIFHKFEPWPIEWLPAIRSDRLVDFMRKLKGAAILYGQLIWQTHI